MIKRINIENFKCFKKESVNLDGFTVIAGENNIGKSTLIQAILLTSYALEDRNKKNQMNLNQKGITLGNHSDIINFTSSFDEVKLAIDIHEHNLLVELKKSDRKGFANVEVIQSSPAIEVLQNMTLPKVKYLSSNRIAPDLMYQRDDLYEGIGAKGENTVHYLSDNFDKKITFFNPRGLKIETTLGNCVNMWMDYIIGNISVIGDNYDDIGIAVLNYQTNIDDKIKSGNIRPTNVGFGITFLLPLVVQLIDSIPSEVCIIENPELNLHPSAQIKITELMAASVSNGSQVIVETHSDHIINGVRLCAKSKKVSNEKIQFMFLSRPRIYDDVKISSISIDKSAKLSRWPKGFFDENEKVLMKLL